MNNKKRILWITHTAVFIALLVVLQVATAKFLILYLGIVQVAVSVFLGLPEQQAAVVSNMFSIPQLITALSGGIAASIILPTLKKAIKTC